MAASANDWRKPDSLTDMVHQFHLTSVIGEDRRSGVTTFTAETNLGQRMADIRTLKRRACMTDATMT